MPCRPAITSMSLGRAWVHKLETKLDEAHTYGYQGLELFYEDIEYYAQEKYCSGKPPAIIAACKDIRSLCETRNITIMALQPFMHYEGLVDRQAHKARLEKLRFWFQLAKILGTDTIQIPCNFLPAAETTSDMSAIVADLVEVADMAAKENPPLRFAYESLCWGTHIDTWDLCWEVVTKVDRPNFGACLDTYNIAGRVYADPAAPSGKTPNADADMAASIERLVKTIDMAKVFYIQIVDAERLDAPLVEGHPFYDPDQPKRMSWSRNCRLFYGEEERGAYLPVKAITKAILEDLRFDGWVSMELFNRSMADPAPETPREHARRGMEAWAKIKNDFEFEAA